MSRKRKIRPEHSDFVTDYASFDRYVAAFRKGLLNLLIVIGSAGIAKSKRFEQAFADQPICVIKGNTSAFGLYQQLWQFRDSPVVLDDIDGLFRDPRSINLLKCLCETATRKKVSWNTAAPDITKGDLPPEFMTKSQVAILTNDWRTLDANVGALENRGHLVFFQPSAIEVHREVAAWFGKDPTDREIFYFIGENLHLIQKPSMRQYVLAAEQKKADLPWRENLLGKWLKNNTLVVAQLLLETRFQTEAERVLEFTRRTGCKRSDYYLHKDKLLPETCPPDIRLAAEEGVIHAQTFPKLLIDTETYS